MSIEYGVNKPLEIRGHHLKRLVFLLAMWRPTTPEHYAENMVTMAKKSKTPGYTQDLLGTTEEDERSFYEKNLETAKKLIELPEEYPVRILINEPDDICRSCAIGSHCKTGNADWLEVQNFFYKAEVYPTPQNGHMMTLGELRTVVKKYWESF